jgi:hypothetical protein
VAMSTARSLSVRSSRIMARKRHDDELGPLTLGQAEQTIPPSEERASQKEPCARRSQVNVSTSSTVCS